MTSSAHFSDEAHVVMAGGVRRHYSLLMRWCGVLLANLGTTRRPHTANLVQCVKTGSTYSSASWVPRHGQVGKVLLEVVWEMRWTNQKPRNEAAALILLSWLLSMLWLVPALAPYFSSHTTLSRTYPTYYTRVFRLDRGNCMCNIGLSNLVNV